MNVLRDEPPTMKANQAKRQVVNGNFGNSCPDNSDPIQQLPRSSAGQSRQKRSSTRRCQQGETLRCRVGWTRRTLDFEQGRGAYLS
jgi:hypothetical protein